MRRIHKVLYFISVKLFILLNSCHIALKKDFPLDMKIKRENKRTEDDNSVVASDINEDDDVVALPLPKPKPRTNKKNVWDGVAPKYS